MPEQTLDVRHLAPRERHPTIFAVWGALPPGGAFLLVNDHEPKPLYYQFQAEHAGEFEWTPVEPVPLYNVLAKQGFPEHWTERLGGEDWAVYLKRS